MYIDVIFVLKTTGCNNNADCKKSLQSMIFFFAKITNGIENLEKSKNQGLEEERLNEGRHKLEVL